MAPTFPFTALDPVEVFAVEDTSAQIVWRGRFDGHLTAVVDGREVPLGDGRRPGAADVDGLRPDTTTLVEIALDGRPIARRTARTEPSLGGPELARVATINDLHLGELGFGLVKEMCERRPAVAHPLRCALAAVREAQAWGAELLVIKGDITHYGQPEEWDLFDELLDGISIPVIAVPGNHDTVGRGGALDAPAELRRRGLFPDPVQVVDIDGARVVAADSTVPGHSWGQLRRRIDALEASVHALRPTLLFLHQHLEERHVPSFWPLGTPRRSWTPMIDRVSDRNPDLFVSTGHSHRNRARRHGSATLTEVGSTKDHPGVWAGYTIHADGIRQVVRRVAEPSCLAWTERTHAVVGGIWGRWSPGRIEDRSLTHRWVGAPAAARSTHIGARLDR